MYQNKLAPEWDENAQYSHNRHITTVSVNSTYDVKIYELVSDAFVKYLWLLQKGEPVGYLKIFSDRYPGHPYTTICTVEIRPDKRGNKLSRYLYEIAAKQFGTLHRTGSATSASAAVTKALGIIIEPSSRIDDPKEPYSFVEWDYYRGVTYSEK